GAAPEAPRDADDRPGVSHAEPVAQRPQRVERITRLEVGEEPRAGADRFEHEPAGVVLCPRNTERTAEQRRRARAAAQLGKWTGQRGGGEMGQPRDQLQDPSPELLDDEHLTRLECGVPQIRGHDTVWTTPSRYWRTVATRTLFPEV